MFKLNYIYIIFRIRIVHIANITTCKVHGTGLMFTFLRKRELCKLLCLAHLRKFNQVRFVCKSFIGTMCSELACNYIYIASPDQPIYFCANGKIENENERRLFSVSKIFEGGLDHLLIFPKNDFDCSKEAFYVQSAIQAMPVYRNHDLWAKSLLAHCVQFSKGSVRRGVYVNTDFEAASRHLFFENSDFNIFRLIKHTTCSYKLQQIFNADQKESDTFVTLVDRQCPVLAQVLQSSDNVSPIFSTVAYMPVFHDFQRTQDILHMVLPHTCIHIF